ncbi:intermembrane phospholipid transport protein YdbH family protein [Glacieibacterium megasporae]|uniref:intermembrane phospholipid transport protein YdbH family protein n=1 Tax=Glacieibacterium megasporae TaxID=2835787 RepID=UPI001C1DDD6F|nr:YdbH domain-containing protein [Polymorphobacter megasporae]UAJ08894.1 YdbH domain-containing protein [Polymorphobacter megasporae]
MAASYRSRFILRLAGATLLIAAFGLTALWIARAPVTDAAVLQYLAAKGVDAAAKTITVERNRLVFDNVRLGPGASPDLTARRIVIDFKWSAFRPLIAGFRLDGAMLKVHADGGGVSFGSLDRLIPPDRSTRFPTFRLDAADAAVTLLTPAGTIDARVDAAGQLDRDFRATARTATVALQWANCSATVPEALFTITTAARDFAVAGQGLLVRSLCREATVPTAAWTLAVAAPLAFTRLTAHAGLTAPTVQAAGTTLSGLAIDAALKGPPAGLHGSWTGGLAGLIHGPDRAGPTKAGGSLQLAPGSAVHIDATVAAHAVQPATLIALLPSRVGLPTLAAKLVTRAGTALRRIDVLAHVDGDVAPVVRVRISDLKADGAGDAELRFTGRGIEWTRDTITLDGRVTVKGGGLPAIDIAGAGSAKGGHGLVAIGPWRDGGDALELTGGRFDVTAGHTTTAGTLRVSSGFDGGRVDGLTLPLDVAFDRQSGVAIGTGCVHIGFDRATLTTTQLGATAATLCPSRRGPLATLHGTHVAAAMTVDGLGTRGTAGGRAFTASAGRFGLRIGGTLAVPEIAVSNVDLTVVSDPWRVGARLNARAERTLSGWTGTGAISALRAVGPFGVASNGRGRWQLANGVLTLDDAEVAFTDPRPAPAFNPLHLTGVNGRLANQALTGRATVELANGARLATVMGFYDLAGSTGHAALSSTLTFTPALQPVDISGLVRGLVANVAGTVTTVAGLEIAADKVTGVGTVQLAGVGLATAALGPVTGIDGTIAFDDLPSLHTPPHQTLHIAALDPGVAIDDISVRFQLLDSNAVAIERLAWPFTGGTMTVEPTVLRADVPHRTFTVDVDGLDAEQFLQRFQIKNLSATGKFDGVLPLVFERSAGRIAGGVLTARDGGGLLQYVGEVGQASMGAAGRLAFDALRRLRYRTLTLRLDGDLDAEIVTASDFTGTNEAPLQTGSRLPVRATGLPFKFGVTVRAPFRLLLGTAASFSDARAVIRSAKPVE